MIFAYLAAGLGVAVWFVPEPVRPVLMVACLVCGALYLRAMNRRARDDAQ